MMFVKGFSVLIIAMVLSGCCVLCEEDPKEADRKPVTITINGVEVSEVLYILQDIDLQEISTSDFDLVIMDYSFDGSDEQRLSPADVASIHQDRVLLSYMSIGEAEDYRWYWNGSWDDDGDGVPDPGAPSWLENENENWEGNYKVRYWDPNWQEIILGADSYLSRVLDAGFDGVYLDLVDAWEYWEENHSEAKEDMQAFIADFASSAREADGDFLVVLQNGEGLGIQPGFEDVIDGLGRESIFFENDAPNPERDGILSNLSSFSHIGKFIIDVEYVEGEDVAVVEEESASRNFLLFVGDEELAGIPQ